MLGTLPAITFGITTAFRWRFARESEVRGGVPRVYSHCVFHRSMYYTCTIGTYPPHIYGSTCFRDNVEDEWLVVYLLYSISRLYPQLVIRSDSVSCMLQALCSFSPPACTCNSVLSKLVYRGFLTSCNSHSKNCQLLKSSRQHQYHALCFAIARSNKILYANFDQLVDH